MMFETHPSRRDWHSAVACAVGAMLQVTTLIVGTFPVFLQPVCQELGWSRGTFSEAIGFNGLVVAFFSPLVGRWVDRWGARRFMLPGIVLYALNVMALSRLTASPARLYVVFGILGLDCTLCGLVPLTKVISATFYESRGAMLGILGGSATVSVAGAVAVARFLIVSYGWRMSYLILGLSVLVVGFPIMLLFLRDPPMSTAAESRVEPTIPGVPVRDALAGRAFWLMFIAALLTGSATMGLIAHSFAWLTGRSVSGTLATSLVSLIAVGQFFGQISSGLLLDRAASPKIAISFFATTLLGTLMLDYYSAGWRVLPVAALVLGMGTGAQTAVFGYFISRFFGLASFASIQSLFASAFALSATIGISLMGACFDRFGSYEIGIHACEAAVAVSTILIAFLGPYVYSARRPGQQQRILGYRDLA